MVSELTGRLPSQWRVARLNPCFIWNMVSDTVSMPTPMAIAGLNPCFNGIWSRTQAGDAASVQEGDVLILVLMEYGLGHIYRWAS